LGTEITKKNTFSITVPVGTYHMKFFDGYYTECGKTMDQVCNEDNSHYNLDIVVQENQTVNSITPCDFYYNGENQKKYCRIFLLTGYCNPYIMNHLASGWYITRLF
jgi:hypothetical protein